MDESPERRALPTPGLHPEATCHGSGERSLKPAASEPVSEETKKKEGAGAPQKKGKRKKKGSSKEQTEGKPKGVLLEETPALDTIEVRHTVRIVAGSIAAFLCLIVGLVVFRVLTARPVKVESSDAEKIELVDIHKVKLQSETEAATLLERGHEAARRGNHELAIRMLTRVSKGIPRPRPADAAREALARPVQHLPLFPDSPPLAAEAAPV